MLTYNEPLLTGLKSQLEPLTECSMFNVQPMWLTFFKHGEINTLVR